MNNISFLDWYSQFQKLISLWKELSANQNWIEAHSEELKRHGLNPSDLNTSVQSSLEMLTCQILHYDKESK